MVSTFGFSNFTHPSVIIRNDVSLSRKPCPCEDFANHCFIPWPPEVMKPNDHPESVKSFHEVAGCIRCAIQIWYTKNVWECVLHALTYEFQMLSFKRSVCNWQPQVMLNMHVMELDPGEKPRARKRHGLI